MPDLTKNLREAAPEVQRQVFEAFELQIPGKAKAKKCKKKANLLPV